jgi:hypothetical protein
LILAESSAPILKAGAAGAAATERGNPSEPPCSVRNRLGPCCRAENLPASAIKEPYFPAAFYCTHVPYTCSFRVPLDPLGIII